MLTGRESLVRLIGKRRRFLPNRHSILSSPISPGCLNLCNKDEETEKEEKENGLETAKGSGGPGPEPGPEWVNCPVCAVKVRGENNAINSHLDACLSRGTKRKLSQRTLFQLNFCSRSKVKIHSLDLDQTMDTDVSESITVSNELDDFEECDGKECYSPLDSVALQSDSIIASAGGSNNDDKINNNIGLCSLLVQNGLLKCDMAESVDVHGIVFDTPLLTFIVGRRFGDEVDLNPGAKIFLLRDPENVKDQNAVKVLSADFGCDKVLGFLPRELAQYLSPLMDKFHISFEGHITVVPNNSRDVVPIEIRCQNKVSLSDNKCEDFEVLKSLWRQVSRIVESTKTHPFGTTKYQKNLVLLIQEVLTSYSHLLTDDEKTFLETYLALSHDSQRLFARLYTRKGPWFRLSAISYSEISDCEEAIKGLSEAGYISSFVSSDELQNGFLKEILYLLNVDELREIMYMLKKRFVLPNRMNLHVTKKEGLVVSLLSSCEDGLCPDLANLVLTKTGGCICISASAESLIWRAERLFFLNGEQDLSAFLLVDLGIVKYPSYKCVFPNQIFPNREEMLSYEEAIEVAQVMDESLDKTNSELVLSCIEISNSRISSSTRTAESSSSGATHTFLSCFTASWVYSKVVLLGVSFLEREKRYSDAVTLLKSLLSNFPSDGRRGYWTLRFSIDLEHVGCLNESLQVAEDGLLDPWVRAGSRVALQRRVLRLGKPPRRWKIPSYSKFVKRKITEIHVQGRPLNCKKGMKSIFYGEDGEQCGVEQLALQYYAGEGGGWKGVHTESGIWLTIFGLLMWDILFADVPHVFHTKFQTAPLDLETDCFYEARKSLIEPLLERIKDGMAEEILVTAWEAHAGTACRGVSWDKHSSSELRAAVTCISGPCLASICRHLAQDYRSWSSGMPDLLLWRFHDDHRGEAKLVEVKGPRDRLSEQQHAWLLVLMECGFNIEVCKVSPLLAE